MLDRDLATLPPALAALLRDAGFDADALRAWAARVGEGARGANRVAGDVRPAEPDDVLELPPKGSPREAALARAGLDALARGELAFVVLAGGMATRMGGVVKALVPVLGERTFLDLRLAENDHWSSRAGRRVPLWLMSSHATDAATRAALAERDRPDVEVFRQYASLRLTPEGELFRGADGAPEPYATGHGDLVPALKQSGLLDRFVAEGGRLVALANLDNLGASVDPVVVGAHLEHGAAVTVEIVDKREADRGGIPVRWNDRPVVLEELRLPLGFDATSVRAFNTNTFVIDARALAALDTPLGWVEVEKSVEGRRVVQRERLVGEITTMLATRFLRVPRDGAPSRFLPVKDLAELERRRGEIAAIAAARGMLGANAI